MGNRTLIMHLEAVAKILHIAYGFEQSTKIVPTDIMFVATFFIFLSDNKTAAGIFSISDNACYCKIL